MQQKDYTLIIEPKGDYLSVYASGVRNRITDCLRIKKTLSDGSKCDGAILFSELRQHDILLPNTGSSGG